MGAEKEAGLCLSQLPVIKEKTKLRLYNPELT